MNYKQSTTLNPVIDADKGVNYTVSYESSNPRVATVDENGKVTDTKLGCGSATITCTVTDEHGNTVQDTCTVKVSCNFCQWLLSFIQWLINDIIFDLC
ncbi:MAG: Ig-like domain-containing protein [Clostridia bacterium]|nr:Ig-like domain-containing protein [Clostridia bacterium]